MTTKLTQDEILADDEQRARDELTMANAVLNLARMIKGQSEAYGDKWNYLTDMIHDLDAIKLRRNQAAIAALERKE